MNKGLFLILTCIVTHTSVNAMERTYPLHDAAAMGDIQRLQALLDSGADVNQLDEQCNTPLHWAAVRDSSPYWADEKHTLIDRASKNRRLAIAHLLIKRGANVNAQNNYGDTPLLFSTGAFMHLLLDNGADINRKNKYGSTPLRVAAQNGDKTTAKILLERGAKTTLKWDMSCILSNTPEYIAMKTGHPEIADLIKVWPVVVLNSKARMLTFCMAMHSRVGTESSAHILSQHLFQEICSYLKPEAITLRNAMINQDIEAITALLNAGADVNTQEYDLPLLHVAITYRNIDIIKLLLAHGADVNYENIQGKTAFDLAHKDLAITELLRNYPVTKHQKQTQSGCIIS